MSNFRRKILSCGEAKFVQREKCTVWWDAILNQGTFHSSNASSWIPAIGDASVYSLNVLYNSPIWDANCLTCNVATSGEYSYLRRGLSMNLGTGDFTSVAIINVASIPQNVGFGYVIGEGNSSGSGVQRWEVNMPGDYFRFSQVVTSSGWEHFFKADVPRSTGFIVLVLTRKDGIMRMYVNGKRMKLTALKNESNLVSDTEYRYEKTLSAASGSYPQMQSQVWYKDSKRYARLEYVGYSFTDSDAENMYEWAKAYYQESGTIIPDKKPKFDVTANIETYNGDYRYVYVSSREAWFVKNEGGQYEAYGVVDTVASLDSITKYLGKKVVKGGRMYEWNGKTWIDYGTATKPYIFIPTPENYKVFASKEEMNAYDRPWVGMIAYVGENEYEYKSSFMWTPTSSWVKVETTEWIESSKQVAGYHTYMSNSNKGVNNGWAYAKVTWSGIPDFKLYLCSYAEGSYDYSIAYAIDSEKASQLLTTSGFQKDPSAGISSFKECSYPNDGGEHFVWLAYRKDGSVNSNDDRGYLAISEEYSII